MNNAETIKQPIKSFPTVSALLPTGEIAELVYEHQEAKTRFVIWDGSDWKQEEEIKISETEHLVPFSPKNNLIQNEVVLLPSHPEEYGSEETLLSEIETYIHRYVDVTPSFEKIASYYVLLSWIYDNFNELPYLRLKGEPGSGKTRFLQTVGAICYKPIFASGASSISPIFRILDSVKGTLVIDESDFRISDEKAEMVKILNNGNVKGFPVLRSEVIVQTKEFNPRAYQVYGPKLIATRGFFEDRALESRCLTEEMGQRRLREDIPINLPDKYKDEALHIRNKLLLFRFRNYGLRKPTENLIDRTIEPRLNQIFNPLLSIVKDPTAQADIQELARSYNRQIIQDRGMDTEAKILEIIRDLRLSPDSRVSVKEITDIFIQKHGQDYERRITAKYIGYLIRHKLGLKPQRTELGFVIPSTQQPLLERLYERYGLDTPVQRSGSSGCSSLSSSLSPEQNEHHEHHEHCPGGIPPDVSNQPPEPNPQGPESPPANLPLENQRADRGT